MIRTRNLSLLGLLLAWPGAAWALPTSLAPNPDGAGEAYTAVYSEAVMLRAKLDADGDPIAGRRVSFTVTGPEAEDGFVLDDPVTDAAGVATARLTLVNGRYGGQSFPAEAVTPESEGARYVITMRFAGDVAADDPACMPSDGGVADAGSADGGEVDPLCPTETEVELFVGLETAEIELQPGNRVALGEELTLIATLNDEDGVADLAGTEINGSEPAPVDGASVSFYFDLDRDERPSADERIGSADTDSNGIATLTFTADPAFYFAGDFPAGLHVQFGGDDRYALAGASGRIVIEPGAASAANTVIEAEPAEALADGITRIQLTAVLVDSANNPLAVDSPESTVYFTSTLGTVLGEGAERDPITGYYSQELRAPDEPGVATVTVNVDGVDGATRDITFADTGNCACASPRHGSAPIGWAALFVALGFGALRRRKESRYDG